MTDSDDVTREASRGFRTWVRRALSIAFWLVIWEVTSILVDQPIILVGPLEVVKRLSSLVMTQEFWVSVALSLSRIACGYILAVIVGVALAVVASQVEVVSTVLSPVVGAIKAAPVASFVILVLLWVPSRNLSVIISFLMAFPIVYTNVFQGMVASDPKLLEMARVFGMRTIDKVRYIYLDQVLPYLRVGLSLALGLSWKSGIAAEVIGLPDLSIGEHLYDAKIYLDTPSLFAWTLVIIVLSVTLEALVSRALDSAMHAWEVRP